MMYRFKIRSLTMDLPEPTQEAFDKFYEDGFLSFFLDGIKDQIKEDLQILIDTKTWTEVEDNDKKDID